MTLYFQENLDLAVTKIGQCNVKICLQKRDYLVGVAFTDVWSPLVVYIPTRSHPNIVVSEVDLGLSLFISVLRNSVIAKCECQS